MKMYIMKGLPASGKSTMAFNIIKNTGNTVRINKDLIRKMLHFNKFTGPNESITGDTVRSLAKMFLADNKNVIIDDTNLNPRVMQSWKDLAKEMDAKTEIVDLTEISVEECVTRDNGREESVGGTVIKNMAIRYGLKKFDTASVVLCDIDGTIADITHRLHFVNKEFYDKKIAAEKEVEAKIAAEKEVLAIKAKKNKKKIDKKEENLILLPDEPVVETEWVKDWKGFFNEMPHDDVRKEIQAMLINYYNQGKTVIFITARPENYKEATLRWLAQNFLTFAYTVIMRREGDKRADTEVKKEMIETFFPDKKVIFAIFDDRPSVIRLWEEMELPVIDVGNGKEF